MNGLAAASSGGPIVPWIDSFKGITFRSMTRTGVAFMVAVLLLGYAAVVLFVVSFESHFTLTILLLTVFGALISDDATTN
jgi:hypothetical protein